MKTAPLKMMHSPQRKQRKGDAHQALIATLSVVISISAIIATGSGVSAFTERGGGLPAPPRPAKSAVRDINPETTTVFTDQSVFLDSVSCRTLYLESFETTEASNQINLSGLTLDKIAVSTGNPPQIGVWNRQYQGAFATHGNQWLGIEEASLVVPHVTTLTFDRPINHFSVNITDFGDFGGGNLIFANDIGDEATAAFSGQASGNHQFFGIINTARGFRIVTLSHNIGGEFYGIDEVTFCFQGRPNTAQNRRPSGRVIPD